MTSPRRAAIFDFDGTIADSLHEVAAVYNEVAVELGVPVLATSDYATIRQMSPTEALRAFQVPLRKLPRLMSAVRGGMRERIPSLRPFDGIPDALRQIHGNGCRCGILSSNAPENVHHFLDLNGFGQFDLFSCGASLFGKAARLRRLVRQVKLAPEHIYFVGDEVRDITAAAEAGVRSIAVSWGYAAREALAAARPDHIADTPSELAAIIAGN